MVACTMSMDIMAIDEDELLPNVNFGGVALISAMQKMAT